MMKGVLVNYVTVPQDDGGKRQYATFAEMGSSPGLTVMSARTSRLHAEIISATHARHA